VPDRLDVLTRRQHRAEIETDLAEKLVGAETVIVPDGDLQDPGTEVGGSDPRIDEALVPLRTAGVDEGLCAALRELSGVGYHKFSGERGVVERGRGR
jgi:hypothetical protein